MSVSQIQVDIDEVRRHFEYRAKINRADIHDIVWMKDGKPLEVSKEMLDAWLIIGLNNIDFAKELLYPGTNVVMKIYAKQNPEYGKSS